MGYTASLLRNVDPAAELAELDGLLLHTETHRLVLTDTMIARVVADVLRDAHAAELGPAHRAEMRDLGTRGRERLVVHRASGLGIEAQVELIFPAEVEACLRERVVPPLRARMPLGEVGCMRRDLVGDDPVFHVLPIRQAEMF